MDIYLYICQGHEAIGRYQGQGFCTPIQFFVWFQAYSFVDHPPDPTPGDKALPIELGCWQLMAEPTERCT